MKILNLRFENINSLTGKSEIEFTKSPLSDTGIFLICGPTGAGKTTILDAICIALYEKTPRLEGSAVRNLMSQQKGYCVSEVDFSVKDKIYRAKWELRRAYSKPDGNFQDSTRELSILDGDEFKIIENKKKDINDTIENVTGLNFNRFTRSVLLPQGNFAAFLDAKDDERADLLEKMTGTTIYSKISQKVFEINKEEKNKYEDLKRKFEDIRPLSEEDIEELKGKRAELGGSINALKKKIEVLTGESDWLKKIEGLKGDIESAGKNLKIAEEVKEKSTDKFKSLERALRANVFRPELDRIDYFQKSKELKVKRTDDLNREIPLIDAEFKKVIKEICDEKDGFEAFKKIRDEKNVAIDKAVVKESEIKERESSLSAVLKKSKALESNMEELNRQKTKCISELEELKESKESVEKFIEENSVCSQLETFLFMLSNNVIDIESLREQFEKSEAEIKLLNGKRKKIEGDIEKSDKEFKKAEDKLKVAGHELEKVEKEILGNDGRNETFMEEEFEKLKIFLGLIESVIKTDGEIKEVSSKLEETKKSLLKNESDLKKLKEDEEEADLKIKSLEAEIKELEEKLKQELLISKYEDDRAHLNDGKPCPLCGSKDHPVGNIEYKEGETQRELTGKNNELSALRDSLNKITKSIIQVMTGNEALLKEKVNFGKELDGLIKLRDEEFGKLEIKDGENLKSVYEGSKKKKEGLEVKLRNLKELRKRQTSLNEAVRELLKTVELKMDVLSELRSELKSCDVDIKSLLKESESSKKSIGKIEKEIGEIADKYKIQYVPGNEKKLSEELEGKGRDYKKKTDELKNIEKKVTELKEKDTDLRSRIKGLSESIEEAGKEKSGLEENLGILKKERKDILDGSIGDVRKSIRDREKIFLDNIEKFDKEKNRLESDLKVKNESLKNITSELKGIEEDLRNLNSKLLDSIKSKGFDTVNELKRDLIGEEVIEKLSYEKKEIEDKILKEGTRVADLKKQYEILSKEAKTDSSLGEIKVKFDEASKELETLNKELWEIDRKLREDKDLRKKQNEQVEKIERLRKEYSKWSMLNELIGSADGKKFRKFAQGLTLEHLINLANMHLARLNKRYQMRRKVDEDLGIDIVDTYKADLSRPVKTLSGGESFLVSLSLALGLSSLVSRDVRIDSLFLDEGFGSLDKDSMDLALDALDNLNAMGKTIGIISHIDSMRERIPVQIEVIATAHGESRIVGL